MTSTIKWLTLLMLSTLVSAVSYILFRQSKRINSLQSELLSAKVEAKKDQLYAKTLKQRTKYEDALKAYLGSLDDNDVIILDTSLLRKHLSDGDEQAEPLPPGPGGSKLLN